jgi:4-amino-4-deoxy-L-arabinose transferase-like glycosyltransferase
MKNKSILLLSIIFVFFIFITQLKLVNRPVIDNDEGIYQTSFLLINKGYPAYKKTYFSQPPGFILSVFPGFKVFGKTLQASRLMISLWSMVGLLTIIWIGFELGNVWFGLMAICLLFLVPSYTNQTLTLQSDILITTFSLLSFVFLIKFRKSLSSGRYILSVFFINLAFWTKFDITFFPSFGLIILLLLKEQKISFKHFFNLLLIFFAVSIAFFGIFIYPFGIREVFNNSILLRFQAASSSSTPLMLFQYLKNDRILSLIILSNLLISIFNFKKIKYPVNIFFIWSAFDFSLFLFYRPLFPHHLVLLTVPTVLLFSQLVNQSINNKKIFQYLVLALFLISLSNRINTTVNSKSGIINKQQQSVVEIIKNNTSTSDFVVSDEEILSAVSGRLPPPELSDISQVRIKSGNLSADNFAKIIEDYKPKLIIPWNGRLKSIKNFDEVVKNYIVIYLGQDKQKTILLRQ